MEERLGKKRMDTYQVNGTTSISHVMYVDDVLIFSETNKKSLPSIKSILADFSQFLGLCDVNSEMKDTLMFTNIDLPITFLGLPIIEKKTAPTSAGN